MNSAWAGANGQIQTMLPKLSMATVTLFFWIKQDIAKDASYGCNGHAIHVVRHKIWKVWDVVPLRQSFRPSNFSNNTIQVRTNTMHTCPPSLLRAPCCSREEMSTPKRGRKCYITPAFSGVPNKGGQNQNSKPPLGVTMMPLGAPSISKYGSLVRPDAQIVALRLRRPPRIRKDVFCSL